MYLYFAGIIGYDAVRADIFCQSVVNIFLAVFTVSSARWKKMCIRDSIKSVEHIMDEAEYPGIRIKMESRLENTCLLYTSRCV